MAVTWKQIIGGLLYKLHALTNLGLRDLQSGILLEGNGVSLDYNYGTKTLFLKVLIVLMIPFLHVLSSYCYLKKFIVVAKYTVAHKVTAGKLLTCKCNFLCLKDRKYYSNKRKCTPSLKKKTLWSQCPRTELQYIYYLHLFVMFTSPLDFFQQVSQIRPDGNVVLPWCKLIVEMLVVARILL